METAEQLEQVAELNERHAEQHQSAAQRLLSIAKRCAALEGSRTRAQARARQFARLPEMNVVEPVAIMGTPEDYTEITWQKALSATLCQGSTRKWLQTLQVIALQKCSLPRQREAGNCLIQAVAEVALNEMPVPAADTDEGVDLIVGLQQLGAGGFADPDKWLRLLRRAARRARETTEKKPPHHDHHQPLKVVFDENGRLTARSETANALLNADLLQKALDDLVQQQEAPHHADSDEEVEARLLSRRRGSNGSAATAPEANAKAVPTEIVIHRYPLSATRHATPAEKNRACAAAERLSNGAQLIRKGIDEQRENGDFETARETPAGITTGTLVKLQAQAHNMEPWEALRMLPAFYANGVESMLNTAMDQSVGHLRILVPEEQSQGLELQLTAWLELLHVIAAKAAKATTPAPETDDAGLDYHYEEDEFEERWLNESAVIACLMLGQAAARYAAAAHMETDRPAVSRERMERALRCVTTAADLTEALPESAFQKGCREHLARNDQAGMEHLASQLGAEA